MVLLSLEKWLDNSKPADVLSSAAVSPYRPTTFSVLLTILFAREDKIQYFTSANSLRASRLECRTTRVSLRFSNVVCYSLQSRAKPGELEMVEGGGRRRKKQNATMFCFLSFCATDSPPFLPYANRFYRSVPCLGTKTTKQKERNSLRGK